MYTVEYLKGKTFVVFTVPYSTTATTTTAMAIYCHVEEPANTKVFLMNVLLYTLHA